MSNIHCAMCRFHNHRHTILTFPFKFNYINEYILHVCMSYMHRNPFTHSLHDNFFFHYVSLDCLIFPFQYSSFIFSISYMCYRNSGECNTPTLRYIYYNIFFLYSSNIIYFMINEIQNNTKCRFFVCLK